jgi:carbon monoxide dehydrogenase subunit G
MATFESKININRSLGDVYQFLADFNNHQQLMPDNIQNWTSTFNGASFGIQNMAQLSLQIAERVENQSIKIVATGNPPFSVQLNWDLEADGDSTNVTFAINAELNMMMKMMASGPLQKLADHEVESLSALLSRD